MRYHDRQPRIGWFVIILVAFCLLLLGGLTNSCG